MKNLQYEPPIPPVDKYGFATFKKGESRTFFENISTIRSAVSYANKKAGGVKLFTSRKEKGEAGTTIYRLK